MFKNSLADWLEQNYNGHVRTEKYPFMSDYYIRHITDTSVYPMLMYRHDIIR